MSFEKKGIDLVIDRVEALRVRLGSAGEKYHPDEPYLDFDHWTQLCIEAKTEAVKVKHAYEHIINWLALRATDPPTEPSPDDVARAVEICVKRCQELEQKVIDLEDGKLGPAPTGNLGLVVPPGHIAVVRDKDGSLREVRGPSPFKINPQEIYKAILGSIKNLSLAKKIVSASALESSAVDEVARNAAQVVVSMLEAQLE